MSAGRPRSFDEQVVLDRATQLFWQKGYEGVGMAELCRHMGLSRQSLYGAFGSKRGLFIRCIEHYRTTQLSQALALLEGAPPYLDQVRAVVGFFEALAVDERCRGCLVANTLVELAPHDEEIRDLLGATLELLRARIEATLERARQAGELSPEKSPRELSRALTNSMIGLAVTGKLPISGEAIRQIHSGTLQLLA